MYRNIRHLLLYALLLAIPLQGVTATAMLFCMSGHHSNVSSAEAVHSPDNLSNSHDNHDAPVHHQPPVSQAIASSGDHHDGMNSGGKCSACSLCYNLLAIPNAVPVFGTSFEAKDYSIADLHTPFGPVLEGLKRPPRSVQT
jgi:hypothetical protein